MIDPQHPLLLGSASPRRREILATLGLPGLPLTQLTGRSIGPDGRAADGRKLGVAVARNAEVVPRSQWHATALADGDDVELVTAVQGG